MKAHQIVWIIPPLAEPFPFHDTACPPPGIWFGEGAETSLASKEPPVRLRRRRPVRTTAPASPHPSSDEWDAPT
ncbi:hypothetical protein SEVIR_7G154450v4 [Setaria viridis]